MEDFYESMGTLAAVSRKDKFAGGSIHTVSSVRGAFKKAVFVSIASVRKL